MSNYTRGRQKEYDCMDAWEKEGYEVIRSAGSHGKADVVAWNAIEVVFVQVKYNCKITSAEYKALEEMPVPIGARIEVWEYTKGNKTPLIRKVK